MDCSYVISSDVEYCSKCTKALDVFGDHNCSIFETLAIDRFLVTALVFQCHSSSSETTWCHGERTSSC